MDLLIYLIGAYVMVAVVDCGKYHPALRRQTVALFSQSLGAAHISNLRGDYNREERLLQVVAISLYRCLCEESRLIGTTWQSGGVGRTES